MTANHMKAILVSRAGGPEVMELADVPVPLPKAAEAVVKVAAAGVNSIDLYFRDGRFKTPLPFVPGQEGAGVVTAVGSEAKSVKVGDRVAWGGTLGSYAEHVTASAATLVPVPDGVSDQDAAGAMMQGLTAHYLCHDAYRLKAGDTALVLSAAGGVGLLLVQMARQIGARVIGTVSNDEKADLARAAGAGAVNIHTRPQFDGRTQRLKDGPRGK